MEAILEGAFDFPLPRICKIREQGNTVWYHLEPLAPGYGMTLAHTVKRVLQFSVVGAAVTAVRINSIDGMDVPGLEETVADLLLNVKQLRVRSLTQQPTYLSLDVCGERNVSAADLITPDTIEVLNPEVHLATLQNEHARLVLELVVETGRGYVPAELKTDHPSGFLPVDAIYTPIRKVEYTIEHVRIGKMVNFDKIVFEIETDGTLSPEEAFNQSGEILVQQLLPLTTLTDTSDPDGLTTPSAAILIPRDIYTLPLSALKLSARSTNAFRRNGVTNVGQILMMDEEALLRIRNFGERSIAPLFGELQRNGCFMPLLLDETAHLKET